MIDGDEIEAELDLPWLQIGCSGCAVDISGFYDPLDPPYYCAECVAADQRSPDQQGEDG